MKKLVIYKCEVCGNIVVKLVDSGVPVFCCGQPMTEIKPNTVDAASEKHKPVVKVNSNEVIITVGEVEHPMLDNHYISMIILEKDKGFSVKYLYPNEKPTATFNLAKNEKVISVYSYCNLHGLWK